MIDIEGNRIPAEIITSEYDARLAQYTILGGLIVKAEEHEAEAKALRATIESILKEPFPAPEDQEIRVKTQDADGLFISVLQAGSREDGGGDVKFWQRVWNLNDFSGLDCIRQRPSGEWRFYGCSINYDPHTQQIWVFNQDKTARALYREGVDELQCVQQVNSVPLEIV